MLIIEIKLNGNGEQRVLYYPVFMDFLCYAVPAWGSWLQPNV